MTWSVDYMSGSPNVVHHSSNEVSLEDRGNGVWVVYVRAVGERASYSEHYYSRNARGGTEIKAESSDEARRMALEICVQKIEERAKDLIRRAKALSEDVGAP